MKLLPNLKNKILCLNESKELYDEAMIDLIKFLYNYVTK